MKRVLFSLLAMFAVGSLWAQRTVEETDLSGFSDAFYNPATEVVPGKEALLPIYMRSSAALTGCQVSIVLPDGVEFVEVGELNANRYVKNGILEGNVKDGVLTIFGAVVEDHGFKAGDDLLGYIKIKVSESMTTGEYPVVYKDATMSGRRNVTDGVDGEAIVEKLDEVAISQEVTSKIIVTDRLTLDENATEPFAAYESINVKLTRTFQAGKWNTLVLPFTIPGENGSLTEIFGNDVEIVKWSGWTLEGYDDATKSADRIELQFKSLTPVQKKKGIEAGNVYLVKTSKSDIEISMDNVKLVTDVVPTSIEEEYVSGVTGTFTGTFVKMSLPEEVFFISNDLFYRSVGKTTIKGFRAWFDLNPIKLSEEALSKMSINVDGETTAIEGINANQRVVEGVYDLQGRKVMVKDGDINNLQRGIYIINGKKVAIK
ncbi:MAG: hypothetical protein ILA29_05685 [Prevotella sp.]|nr:hypothetical protein [Prevotella sp.]